MAPRIKDILIGIMIGLIMATFFVGRTLLQQPYVKNEVHTLTERSPTFQPEAVIRLDFPNISSEREDVASEISRKVRVLVWVMTSPKNLMDRAKTIKITWGKRCNILIFFSSVSDALFPTVGLNVPEGREHLTGKTMAAFRYIYEHHLNEADWFMKADDDTYVIVENLRYFLSDKNTNDPIYFGHLFKVNVQQGYYSGGGGYVISKEALRRFGTKAINSTVCREDGGDEDVEFGLCMEKLGIGTSRSLDDMGRSVFHPQPPSKHFLGTLPPWHYKYTAGIVQKGFEISRYAVSFHYVPPEEMKLLDFYLYHLRPYGVHSSLTVWKNSTKS